MGFARLWLVRHGVWQTQDRAANTGGRANQPDIPETTPLTETTFADFGLAENILKAVTESGYTIPTPIQR